MEMKSRTQDDTFVLLQPLSRARKLSIQSIQKHTPSSVPRSSFRHPPRGSNKFASLVVSLLTPKKCPFDYVHPHSPPSAPKISHSSACDLYIFPSPSKENESEDGNGNRNRKKSDALLLIEREIARPYGQIFVDTPNRHRIR